MIIKTLTEAVRIATGIPDAAPRPGQLSLTRHIEEAMEVNGHVVGVAPTGSGKSFSLLAPAMIAAAENGERTIISTESLSLQAQIMEKDAPNAAAACEKVTGTRPKVALLKGFSNYVCLAAARDTAEAVTDLTGTRSSNKTLLTKLGRMKKSGSVTIDGRPFDKELGIPLLQWALSLDEGEAGDKQTYRGALTNELWNTIAVGPSECIGTSCPLFDMCKPRAARAEAAEADIVVTNHSMLAVQAAKAVPVIIGNRTLGEFHMIMIDEAHTLPANVRKAGACEVSSATLMGLVRSASRILDEMDSRVERLMKEGNALAAELNDDLTTLVRSGPRMKPGEVFKLNKEADPVENTGDMLIAWAKSLKNHLEKHTTSANVQASLKAKRLTGRADSFIASVAQVKLHKSGTARWVEEKTPGTSARNHDPYWAACASPVNVGGLLAANLWTAPVMADEEDEMAQALKEAGEIPEVEMYDLTVVAVSATLPARFGYQAGLKAENVEYPSPFDAAYGRSVFYVAKPDEEGTRFLYPGWSRGTRAKFNAGLHQEWAAQQAVDLVSASGGGALVLSANSAGGKAYAKALRAASRGRWTVYSQWDGLSGGQMVDKWRAEESSVLVGTKSFMTGVDAPGPTNRLTIIDRIPRSAGNPEDDARVEALMEAMATDKWSADRFVYVSDASLLLEQGAGRLIRSVKDTGMVALLDPRLLKNQPVSYPEPTRAVYKKAFARFTTVTTTKATALEFLRSQAADLPARAAA